jgi:hypothetical protein
MKLSNRYLLGEAGRAGDLLCGNVLEARAPEEIAMHPAGRNDTMDRRALLTAPAALGLLALPAPAAAAQDPGEAARWAEIEAVTKIFDWQGAVALQVPLAIRRARLMGLRPGDFSGAEIDGQGYEKTLILHFGKFQRDGVRVLADRAERRRKA